ncbi:MAG: hypothetical protein WCF33_19590 [Pseudonocardiaceae bacterium]
MFVTVLLLAAVGFLIAALGTGHAGLAWGSVAFSAVAAALIMRRWRRSWLQRQDEPADLVSVTAAQQLQLDSVSAEDVQAGDTGTHPGEEGEEDTDAADLLVVYELIDDVLVIDEHPRYHLPRCRWSDHERAERLAVREARELGFTPCGRCRPDTTLVRKYRAARPTTTGSG